MNDLRRSEQPNLERNFKEARDGSVLKDIAYSQKLTGEETKPITSDMTVAEIIIKAVTGHDMKMYELRHGADYGVDGFEATQLERVEEALAAIEAHYAAIRKADMEYVIGEDELSVMGPGVPGYQQNLLRKKQRQRMAERLNNTEEQV